MKLNLENKAQNGHPKDSRFHRLAKWLELKWPERRLNSYKVDDFIEELRRRDGDEAVVDPLIRAEYEPLKTGEIPAVDPSDANNKKYRKPPFEYTTEEWHLGWTDGRCGELADLNGKIPEGDVRRELEVELKTTEEKIAECGTGIPAFEQLVERKRIRFNRAEELFNDLTTRRNANYIDFSKPLGYLYFIFAVCLFAADIPLSLKLVASGFQVPVEADMPSDVPKIGSASKLLIDHLLFHPWYVIGTFWEPMTLAAGIALVGIIVKYYLDVVILPRRGAERPHWIVIIVLTIILFGFVGTLYSLGHFRAEQQQQAVRREIEDKLRAEDLENRTFNQSRPNTPRPVYDEHAIAQEVENRYKAKAGVTASQYLIQTFIALTLLLPIIGGVCFSASGAKLRNANQYKVAKSEYAECESEFDRASLLLQKENGRLKGLETLKARTIRALETDSEVAWRVSLKRDLYSHGYARGQLAAETLEEGATLYARCEKVVEKLLAKRARNKVSSNHV
jgi:hypothetical protein